MRMYVQQCESTPTGVSMRLFRPTHMPSLSTVACTAGDREEREREERGGGGSREGGERGRRECGCSARSLPPHHRHTLSSLSYLSLCFSLSLFLTSSLPPSLFLPRNYIHTYRHEYIYIYNIYIRYVYICIYIRYVYTYVHTHAHTHTQRCLRIRRHTEHYQGRQHRSRATKDIRQHTSAYGVSPG